MFYIKKIYYNNRKLTKKFQLFYFKSNKKFSSFQPSILIFLFFLLPPSFFHPQTINQPDSFHYLSLFSHFSPFPSLPHKNKCSFNFTTRQQV